MIQRFVLPLVLASMSLACGGAPGACPAEEKQPTSVETTNADSQKAPTSVETANAAATDQTEVGDPCQVTKPLSAGVKPADGINAGWVGSVEGGHASAD
jgi:hypothetical protein